MNVFKDIVEKNIVGLRRVGDLEAPICSMRAECMLLVVLICVGYGVALRSPLGSSDLQGGRAELSVGGYSAEAVPESSALK